MDVSLKHVLRDDNEFGHMNASHFNINNLHNPSLCIRDKVTNNRTLGTGNN
jgi:hypothetical protein